MIHKPRTDNRRRRGQTLVIAIMVMFILAIVATVFVAIVARNLFRAGRYSNVDSVRQIAEAGIRYADQMLTSSEDGADWRPVPDNHGVTDPGNWVLAVEPTPAVGPTPPNWLDQRENFPDFKWTRAYWPTELPEGSPEGTGYAGPTGGFTTFHTGRGRYVLRVSYNPDPNDPVSKYIKIESIGRWGVFDIDDPTTWKERGSKIRHEVTAFKPIGLTDHLRFITNKDNRSMEMPLGVPGYHLNFGRSGASNLGARGGSIRVNGNLLWHGNYSAPGTNSSVDIYLRGAYDQSGNRMPIDRVEVSGEVSVDTEPGVDNSAVTVQLHAVLPDNPDDEDPKDEFVLPSDHPDFTTFHGFYRDGSDLTAGGQFARGVKRIEPPLVDQPDPTNTTTRYRLLTLNSGDRIKDLNGDWINLGRCGWGRGVYINNLQDRQSDSETLPGAYTVRADWLKPNSPLSTYWKGPYYVPLGAIITLHPTDTDGDGQPDFTITRTDTAGSIGEKAVWRDAGGNPRPDWGQTVTMAYPDAVDGRDVPTGLPPPNDFKHIDGNGVIYAEGNIRIRGMLPPGMQLTIVSNQNIYIEGNILKYRAPDAADQPGYETDPYRGADNTCGLALLARENICVNTTQFFSPLTSISADDVGSDAGAGLPPFHVVVTNDPYSQLRCAFEFGPHESDNGTTPPSSWMLFLRHAGQYGPSYINAWLNPSSNLDNWGILWLNDVFDGLPPHVWGIGDPNFLKPDRGIGSSFVGDVFHLNGAINDDLDIGIGAPNLLQIGLDQTTYTRNNYLMGGLAIQPMDIRIEAVLYAQEGSFFVIPGNWFNPNPSDVPAEFRSPTVDPKFPYFGQPLDIRIIVDGAVSENMPAAISDVGEWMSKWGSIPPEYGSSGIATAHPNEGMTFLYDDHVGWPVVEDPGNPGTFKPIRFDAFGRALPIAPKLPVSGSLIYFGEVM